MGRVRKKPAKRMTQHKKIVKTVWVMVMSIVCFTGLASISLYKKNNEYAVMQDELSKQFQEEKQRTIEIAEYQEYVKTDEHVEEIARDKLGFVYENEIVLKPKS